MIICATIRWDVPVTIDIPILATTTEARDELIKESVKEIFNIHPVVAKCIERPDVIDE